MTRFAAPANNNPHCPDCHKQLTLFRGWDEATGADQWYCFRCQKPQIPGAMPVKARRKSPVLALNQAIQQAIQSESRQPIERRCRRLRR